jgi:hypothetical protein
MIRQYGFNGLPQVNQFLAVSFALTRPFDFEQERHLSLLSLAKMEDVLARLSQGKALEVSIFVSLWHGRGLRNGPSSHADISQNYK